MEKISEDTNFWNDAEGFIKENLPDDFEEKFINFIKEKQYNKNERKFFKTCCSEYISFTTQMILLKHNFLN